MAETLGSLLLTKIPEIDLRDIVDEDLAMQRISQTMLRYVMTNVAQLRSKIVNFERNLDDMSVDYQEIVQTMT